MKGINDKNNGAWEGKTLTVAFLTLGCKVNFYETEKMKEQFILAGDTIVPFEDKADVYVINTCTVTNVADKKSLKMLRRAGRNNASALVVAVGCCADALSKKEGLADLFVSNKDKKNLAKIVHERLGKALDVGEKKADEILTGGKIQAHAHTRTRAYLKVQDGCNQYCTYCIIPYVRGELTSYPENEVIDEAKKLAAAGAKEIVVTGIHLSSYGADFTGKTDFTEQKGEPLLSLLRELSKIEGLARIRLSSLEPRIITEEFVKKLAAIPKICPHFHLSLQSGCDRTLARMNRKYTVTEYEQCVKILRREFDRPAITTDVIVGFPQETKEDFLQTCALVKKTEFLKVHVFPYAKREGTFAAAMEGQVEEKVKHERAEKLIHLAKEGAVNYQRQFIHQEESVLFEQVNPIDGQLVLSGHTERYVRVGVRVQEEGLAKQLCNTIQTVTVTGKFTDEIMSGSLKEG